MARTQSRHHGGHRGRLLGAHLGRRTRGWVPCSASNEAAVTGVSHKTAPVEVRERLAFPRGHAGRTRCADLKSREGVSEAVILSTCNRVEIAVTADDRVRPAGHRGWRSWPTTRPSRRQALDAYLYRHEGRDAIHHLFRVAASLDSMVVGEPQILGQLKAAYAAAKDRRRGLRTGSTAC